MGAELCSSTSRWSSALPKNSWRTDGMQDDPIVEEVRKVREAYAARFNCDLEAIFQDLKRQERDSGRIFVSFPPRRISKPPGKRSEDETA
jgi:hypothetical protein